MRALPALVFRAAAHAGSPTFETLVLIGAVAVPLVTVNSPELKPETDSLKVAVTVNAPVTVFNGVVRITLGRVVSGG